MTLERNITLFGLHWVFYGMVGPRHLLCEVVVLQN